MPNPNPKEPLSAPEVILFIGRPNAKNLVRDEFKTLGPVSFLIPESADHCLSLLAKHKDAFLVIDWENGQEEVVSILSQLSRPEDVNFRPVMLMCLALTEVIVGTASEYDVNRLHSGDLTRHKLQEHIGALLQYGLQSPRTKQGIQMVASSRLNNDWEQSLITLRHLHEQDPDDQRITAELIENLIHLDLWTEAAPIAKQLSDSEPGYPRALGIYGRVLMKEHRYPEAIEVMKRANLLNPINVDRLVNLGSALIKIDKISDARAQFEAALKLDASARDASLGLGECSLLEGDVNEALEFMRDITSAREQASIFNSAAIFSMRQGRYEVGKKLYQVAMKSVGEDPFLLSRLIFNLGIGYFRWQRFFDALECFEKASHLDPRYKDARTNVELLARKLKTSPKSATGATSADPNASATATAKMGEFTEKEFEDESVSK
jgi:tetratricopeptide (TPR) repeat protein